MGLTYLDKSAALSPCGTFRLSLVRRWSAGPTLVWLGHNPSTADADLDDPTIRREVAFSAREGYGGLVKVNAMDMRATDPAALIAAGAVPSSPGNGDAIMCACAGRDVIVATGSPHRRLSAYVEEAVRAAEAVARSVRCLGRNADRSGKHPLYVRGDAPFLPWREAA